MCMYIYIPSAALFFLDKRPQINEAVIQHLIYIFPIGRYTQSIHFLFVEQIE